MRLHFIKGCPRDKWEEVQAVQHEPFIYIMGNGSKWAGEEEDNLDTLLLMLSNYRLDMERTAITVNPCVGAVNPNWTWGSGEPRWIDGQRMYACDGVVSFSGNFERYSHGFSIDTNDPSTIATLTRAIERNADIPVPA
jgi:hypothetical protein